MRFLPLCIVTLLILYTVFYLTRRNSGIDTVEIGDDVSGNVRGKSSEQGDKAPCRQPVGTRSNNKDRRGQLRRTYQGPETVRSSHLAQQATVGDPKPKKVVQKKEITKERVTRETTKSLQKQQVNFVYGNPLVLAEVSYSSPFDEGSIGGHVDVPSPEIQPEEQSSSEFHKNEPESREPNEEASIEALLDLPEHIPEHPQEFEDEDEDPEFHDGFWDTPDDYSERQDDTQDEPDGLVIDEVEDDEVEDIGEEDEEGEEELGEFEEYVPETEVEESETIVGDFSDSEPVLEIPYTEVSVYYSSNDQPENGSEKEFGDSESTGYESSDNNLPETKVEEPEEPTPVADYRSKVDSSLFTVLDSFEDNVKVLKLLTRDGAVAKKVKYDGEEIWSGVRRFSTFLCLSAILYFDGDAPSLAVIKTNGLCNTEPTVYRYHDGRKWDVVKKEEHEQLLDVLKKKCKPTTPITLNLVTPNETKLDVYTETESGVSFKTVTPKEGHHISSVVDSGATLWEASGYEKCLLVESYAKNTTKVIYLEVESSGTKSRYFEKLDGAWNELKKDQFYEKAKALIGESGKDISLNISHPNRLLCKSFEYTFAANAIKLVVPNKDTTVTKLVDGEKEIWIPSTGEIFQYADSYLSKDGKAELVFIVLKTSSGVLRKEYVKSDNGWTICTGSDIKMRSLRVPARWSSTLEIDIALANSTKECTVFEVELLGVTTKHFFPKPGYHAKKVKDGNRDLWITMDRSNRCLSCLVYKHGAVELMELIVVENGSRGCILFEKLNCGWKSITEKEFNDKFYKMGSSTSQPKRVSYVSNKTSVYTVCVQCPTHLWYLSQICKISLSIEIANGSNLGNTPQYEPDVESAAKREEIDKLTDDLSHFVASVMAIENHQISENRTSTKLYKSYKRMNRWILLFYVAEIFLICSSAAISVFYVTKFFKRQCIL